MSDYAVGVVQWCHTCGTTHPYPNQHCKSCGHEVCAKCMGCHCNTMICDCAYTAHTE